MKKLFGLSLLAFLLIFTACRDDFEENNTNVITPEPPVTRIVEGDVLGMIVNENGDPMENVQITLGNENTITNEQGFFLIQDADMNAGGAYLTASKTGYFLGSRRFFPQENSRNYIRIQMLEQNVIGSFAAANGGTAEVPEGGQIDFPAGAIARADGSAYDGTVNVAARWLDPTADDLGEIMPGNLQGMNDQGEEVALATYGMMAVELTGSGGEELNIADGQTATLTFPVPAEIQASAPAEIPLWSFDEAVGVWVEEGSATLQGENYVGQVSHFSFWNCDAPFPLINLTGSVIDENDNPIANLSVRISANTAGGANMGYGWTNVEGVFSGKVPKGEELLIEVIDECGNVIFSETFGPYSADVNIGELVLDPATASITQVSGTLIDCDGNPVTNGIVMAQFNNQQVISYVEDGIFDFSLLTCDPSSDITLKGVDLSNQKESDEITVAFSPNIDLGTIDVCDAITGEFFNLDIEGYDPIFIPDPLPYAGQDSSGIGGMNATNISVNLDSVLYFNILLDVNSPGTYGEDEVLFMSILLPPSTIATSCEICGITNVEITAYGDVGEYIEGSFSGTIEYFDPNQQLLELETNASFRIIREN